MSRLGTIAFLTLTALALGGCNSMSTKDASGMSADEAQIRKQNDQWVASVAAKNLDGAVLNYAADAVFMPPNSAALKGDGIRKAWADTLALPGMKLIFAPTSVTVDAGGSLAYDIGTYAFRFDAPHGRFEDHGKYLVVWRKTDGNWKIVADIYNTSEPMAGAGGKHKKK